MNVRLVNDERADAAIGALAGVVHVHDRAALRSQSATQIAAPDRREGYVPAAADFGLTAREAGAWGRLRANGLSPQGAANVVKAARGEGRS